MLFNSFEFLLFFIPVYLLYLVIPHRWQNRLLIFASSLFYAAWNWMFLGVMLLSITVDYLCARTIDAAANEKRRKLFLILSVTFNLLVLGFFKYFNFFIDNLQAIFPAVVVPSLKIILPLGISFYTFEAISYVVDVYRRQVRPANNYWDYLLFVIYFPHLIAGPIMRAKRFLPQIALPRPLTPEQFYQGCFLFYWGLFEKVFVADNLAKICNPIFAQQGNGEGAAVLLAMYAFSFQIFCDFDGYSNMARGLGKIMGFDITVNFNLPYFATNPREFWQRWHISLSTWLRDYLYIPLGGNRNGQARMVAALLITMLLGGLWHGASWTFVLWGLYHAVLLIVYRMRGDMKIPRVLRMILFFHLVALGWLFFRAQSLAQIQVMLHTLFFDFQIATQDVGLWIQMVGIVLPILLVQLWQWKSNELMIIYKQHWAVKTCVYAVMAYLILGFGVMKANEFIYFQF